MKSLSKRLDALEGGAGAVMSPAVKAWLGWKLTEEEREQVSSGFGEVGSAVETDGWSEELKEWLGVS